MLNWAGECKAETSPVWHARAQLGGLLLLLQQLPCWSGANANDALCYVVGCVGVVLLLGTLDRKGLCVPIG